jgi:hypothetical protein
MQQIEEIQPTITSETPKELETSECKDIGGKEMWRKINNIDNYYISSSGRIFSIDTRHNNRLFLKQRLNPKGYPLVSLNKSNKGVFLVHRLVALAFIPNPNSLPQINHKDGIKTNNHISNLEWVTGKENIQHAIKTGLFEHMYGENNANSIFNKNDIINIRNDYINSSLGIKNLAKKYNTSNNTIKIIIYNKTWFDSEYQKMIDSEEFSKIQNSKNICGEKNGACKLNKEKVLNIRKLHKEGKTYGEISKIYPEIHKGSLSDIVLRKTWKHI